MSRGWYLRLRGNGAGAAAMAGILKLAAAANLTPAAGASNNVDPGTIATLNRIRVDTTAGAASFTGIVAGADGQLLWIVNTGANDLTLTNNSGASSAGNRFSGLGDITIPGGGSALIYYDTGVAGGAWVAAV
jgi:hypothetical protein